jgi:hypothetical protein
MNFLPLTEPSLASAVVRYRPFPPVFRAGGGFATPKREAAPDAAGRRHRGGPESTRWWRLRGLARRDWVGPGGHAPPVPPPGGRVSKRTRRPPGPVPAPVCEDGKADTSHDGETAVPGGAVQGTPGSGWPRGAIPAAFRAGGWGRPGTGTAAGMVAALEDGVAGLAQRLKRGHPPDELAEETDPAVARVASIGGAEGTYAFTTGGAGGGTWSPTTS